MGGQDKQLSHDEVWDDSVLIDSWNEALEEYKTYHSIHAKRGRLTDLEKRQYLGVPSSTTDDAQQNAEGATIGAQSSEPAAPTAAPEAHTAPPGPPPQMLLGSIRDENLKKLLMSWYYAGYYTGLYEGQQQAQEEKASSTSHT